VPDLRGAGDAARAVEQRGLIVGLREHEQQAERQRTRNQREKPPWNCPAQQLALRGAFNAAAG